MTVIKTINGHTRLGACHDYLYYGKGDARADLLEKGEDRCLAKDFLGFASKDSEERWDAKMDATRVLFGNHHGRGGEPPITYRHFILSPDPNDKCDLGTLRELTRRWCEAEFGVNGKHGEFQVAIVYHDDNSERGERGLEGIPHAHVIVNNTNLKNGKRLHFSFKEWRGLAIDLEVVSKELGLTYFTVDSVETKDGKIIYERKLNRPKVEKDEPIEQYYSEPERTRKPRRYDSRPSSQEIYRSKKEREIIAKGGTTWKDELRDMIDIACNMSSNMEEFRANLKKMGVETTRRAPKRDNGNDLIFYYPQPGVPMKENKKRVGGSKLGKKYTNMAIEGKMRLAYYRRLDPNDRNEPRLIDLVSEINVVTIKEPGSVELKDISRAFAAINGGKIQTLEEARKLLAQHKRLVDAHPDDNAYKNSRILVENIEALLRVAPATNILPADEKAAKSRPKDWQRRKEMREGKAEEKRTGKPIPIERKIERGWDLTEAEEKSLKSWQRRIWKKNHEIADNPGSNPKFKSLHSGGGSGKGSFSSSKTTGGGTSSSTRSRGAR